MRSWILALVCLCGGGTASAQSFNVDFGHAGSAPSSEYAAAGQAGVWNVIGVLPAFERAPLVDRQGQTGNVSLYMFGGSSLSILDVDDPGTQGQDAALIDDMLIGLNDPVDVCLWFEGLAPGEYEILTYALTPGEPGRSCRVRVDAAAQPEAMIGGAWPGAFSEGLTHARHTVVTASGTIGFHSGLYGGYFQSGINAVQVRPTASLGVGPSPFNEGIGLRAHPNPARGVQWLAPSGPGAVTGRVEILDLGGRRVWTGALAETGAVRWDGRDSWGRRLPPGIYDARWTDSSGQVSASVRLVRLD